MELLGSRSETPERGVLVSSRLGGGGHLGKLRFPDWTLLFLSPHGKEAVLPHGISLSPRGVNPQEMPTKTLPDVATDASARAVIPLASASHAEVKC